MNLYRRVLLRARIAVYIYKLNIKRMNMLLKLLYYSLNKPLFEIELLQNGAILCFQNIVYIAFD